MALNVYFLLLQVLVGESLLKKSDPGKAIEGLFGKNISK